MSPDSSDFLYPFIDGEEQNAPGLLVDLAASAEAKAAESGRLRAVTLEAHAPVIESVAAAMAARFDAGGRLFSFGNGGSATDAAGEAALFRRPPWGTALPAASLAADEAVLTALGNDVGFELIFSRQLIARSRPTDVAFGLSTSGNSTNLLRAFGEARRRGLLSIGFAGYDGGQMAACADLDHCLVVRAESVHRIQESQAALVFAIWSSLQTLVHDRGDDHR
jgi:D-sedoheptulose 7-phosphate isomerase